MSGNQSTPFLKSDGEQNPPPTLSDIIEAERTRLDMIELAREMIDETANRLDSTYMREFYDQLGRPPASLLTKVIVTTE